MTMHRILQAFQAVFSMPPAIVSTKFRTLMREVITEEYPNFRCSAARAILEGKIPGVPKPVYPIHPAWKKRVQQALYLLDLMETICCRYLEEEIKKQRVEIRKDAKDLASNLGSVKIPRLMEAVYELGSQKEKKSARRESKEGSKKGGKKTAKGREVSV